MENAYDTQTTTVVRGFMAVWNKFEATMSKELSQIQNNLQEMHPNREGQPNANYELFYRACNSVYPDGNITMTEFSNALAVPLSTATRIADWLVDKGYVQRIADAEDRRVVRVALTENGKELYNTIDQYVRQRLTQVLSGLTDQERRTFLALVGKIVSGLKNAAG